MRVEIIKPSHWHATKVGQVFKVRKSTDKDDDMVYVDEPGSIYNGNGLWPCDYKILTDDKIVSHEGVEYKVPAWTKYMTRDGKDSRVFAWEREPTWHGNGTGYYASEGKRVRVFEYVKPRPEGNFIVEV